MTALGFIWEDRLALLRIGPQPWGWRMLPQPLLLMLRGAQLPVTLKVWISCYRLSAIQTQGPG